VAGGSQALWRGGRAEDHQPGGQVGHLRRVVARRSGREEEQSTTGGEDDQGTCGGWWPGAPAGRTSRGPPARRTSRGPPACGGLALQRSRRSSRAFYSTACEGPGGDGIGDRALAKPGSQKTASPWSVASWSLALGSKQATKRPKGGFLEPGWGLATQPNKPIVTQYRATDLMHTSDMQGLFFRTKLFSFSMHCMLNQEMSKPCIAIH
jgi:hypothetical protein